MNNCDCVAKKKTQITENVWFFVFFFFSTQFVVSSFDIFLFHMLGSSHFKIGCGRRLIMRKRE